MNWTIAIANAVAFIDDCRAIVALLLLDAAMRMMPKAWPEAQKFLAGCKSAASALDD